MYVDASHRYVEANAIHASLQLLYACDENRVYVHIKFDYF